MSQPPMPTDPAVQGEGWLGNSAVLMGASSRYAGAPGSFSLITPQASGKGVGRHTRSPWAASGSISAGPSRQEQQMRPGPAQAAAPRPSEREMRPFPQFPVPPRQECGCSLDQRPPAQPSQ